MQRRRETKVGTWCRVVGVRRSGEDGGLLQEELFQLSPVCQPMDTVPPVPMPWTRVLHMGSSMWRRHVWRTNHGRVKWRVERQRLTPVVVRLLVACVVFATTW